MSEFDAFDVTHKINDGIRLDLDLPDGSPSGHWLQVRNFRSDAYRDALAKVQADVAEHGEHNAKRRQEDRIDLAASLIAGWSFKAECTPENVREFLRKAALVPEQIDRLCADDARFFSEGSTASTHGPKRK